MYTMRAARLGDRDDLTKLIARSARELSRDDYSTEVVEGALQGAFGVDTQLILDGTYFVVESASAIIGCGGWSQRKTLFGGDARAGRDAGLLDPRTDAAKIRAFFVDPTHARRGVGRMILSHCEREARLHGFTRLELMATLPGVRLYERYGYMAEPAVQHELQPGLSIRFVPMSKSLD